MQDALKSEAPILILFMCLDKKNTGRRLVDHILVSDTQMALLPY
jgi:hypothetical protein